MIESYFPAFQDVTDLETKALVLGVGVKTRSHFVALLSLNLQHNQAGLELREIICVLLPPECQI